MGGSMGGPMGGREVKNWGPVFSVKKTSPYSRNILKCANLLLVPKKKKPTKTQIKKKLWVELRAFIKDRDHNTCWLCGETVVGSNMHCSHILPKGEYPGYEFEEWNLKSLCMHCHLRRWHKNPLVVASEFFNKYPDKYREALGKSKEYKLKPVHYTQNELTEKLIHYQRLNDQ